LHPKNLHNTPYDFDLLTEVHPALSKYLFINPFKKRSLDFFNPKAVLALNKAILKCYYEIKDWTIPENYLCPPIPGRADYIHYIADILMEDQVSGKIKGLDIGVGANCIYPILGSQIYNWNMVGADINSVAVVGANKNVSLTPNLKNNIEIRRQNDNAHIFEGIIGRNEYYHFSMCNPPFHASEKEARNGTLKKLKNLSSSPVKNKVDLNFGGQANELWCNGGEALFVKRMIKQSVNYKSQVGWFTSLISKQENLPKIYKQLDKLKATHKTIEMTQGKKQSRLIAWKFSLETFR